MSAQFFNQLKHLAGQYAALQRAYDDLAERVLELEANAEPTATPEQIEYVRELSQALGADVPVVAPKRRGRPPKVQA